MRNGDFQYIVETHFLFKIEVLASYVGIKWFKEDSYKLHISIGPPPSSFHYERQVPYMAVARLT